MNLFRLFGLTGTVVFALVGAVFLLIPAKVLVFFNNLSVLLGWPQSPVEGPGFYLILAVAYMYLVTVLAYLMYRYPATPCYPFLLSQAKLASCLISLYLFLFHQPYLIYLVNCVADGLIGLIALYLHNKMKREAV